MSDEFLTNPVTLVLGPEARTVSEDDPLPVDPGPVTIRPTLLRPQPAIAPCTLAKAATAQILFAAGEAVTGGVIANPQQADATGQNIAAAESIWYDVTGMPAAQQAGGSAMELKPGQTVELPGGLMTSVSWIATTVNHRISAYKW